MPLFETISAGEMTIEGDFPAAKQTRDPTGLWWSQTAILLGQFRDAVGSMTAYIEPGAPSENGDCESFNARFRHELLGGELFHT